MNSNFDEIRNSINFEVLFMVYRRSSIRNYYSVVSGSIKEMAIPWSVVQRSEFTCMDEVLSSEEHFEILQNDIVGACIKDDFGLDYPLLLVGTSNGSSLRTYQLDRSNIQYCTLSQTNPVDTSDTMFKQRSTSTLHLYANIGMLSMLYWCNRIHLSLIWYLIYQL